MSSSDKIVCHKGAVYPQWKRPDFRKPFRQCSLCGSIHPGDLSALEGLDKASFTAIDFRYGVPQRVRIETPELYAIWDNLHFADFTDLNTFWKFSFFLWERTGVTPLRELPMRSLSTPKYDHWAASFRPAYN